MRTSDHGRFTSVSLIVAAHCFGDKVAHLHINGAALPEEDVDGGVGLEELGLVDLRKLTGE